MTCTNAQKKKKSACCVYYICAGCIPQEDVKNKSSVFYNIYFLWTHVLL